MLTALIINNNNKTKNNTLFLGRKPASLSYSDHVSHSHLNQMCARSTQSCVPLPTVLPHEGVKVIYDQLFNKPRIFSSPNVTMSKKINNS
ncbi:hypothetical protein Hanom_Chr03g00211691 [Helianthus anomalus]